MDFELYLIRHGQAERHNSQGEAARRLTPEGVDEAVAAADALRRLGKGWDEAISSPFTRARHTAEIYCEAVGCRNPLAVWPSVTPSSPASESMEMLIEHGRGMAENTALAVFTHNPHITTLASLLVAGRPDAYFNIRPGDVLHLMVPEFMPFRRSDDGPRAVVLGFYPASELARLKG